MTITEYKNFISWYALTSAYNSEARAVFEGLADDLNNHNVGFIIQNSEQTVEKLKDMGYMRSANLLEALVNRLRGIVQYQIAALDYGYEQ